MRASHIPLAGGRCRHGSSGVGTGRRPQPTLDRLCCAQERTRPHRMRAPRTFLAGGRCRHGNSGAGARRQPQACWTNCAVHEKKTKIKKNSAAGRACKNRLVKMEMTCGLSRPGGPKPARCGRPRPYGERPTPMPICGRWPGKPAGTPGKPPPRPNCACLPLQPQGARRQSRHIQCGVKAVSVHNAPACLCNSTAHTTRQGTPNTGTTLSDAHALTHAQQRQRSCHGRPQLACTSERAGPTSTAQARTCTCPPAAILLQGESCSRTRPAAAAARSGGAGTG